MGACCSSQMGSAQSKHYAAGKGPATHDSAWSVDEPQKAAANGTASGSGAKQQQACSAAGTAAAPKKQAGKKRVANTDLVTGEVIPDMGVHGVFDVLYELGSGGSGRTFLCRCGMAEHATKRAAACRSSWQCSSSMQHLFCSAQAASLIQTTRQFATACCAACRTTSSCISLGRESPPDPATLVQLPAGTWRVARWLRSSLCRARWPSLPSPL
jgi:hypothetical protein